MRYISLFSGVGGFDLGFDRAGFTNMGQCEFDEKAQGILKRHWPDANLHGDISTLSGDAFGPADVVAWGSPCQGLSVAGERKGLDDPRSKLFHEGIRFIDELRAATGGASPRFSVWENVPGALSSAGGGDFQAVLSAFLESEVPMPRSGRWANAGVVRGGGREVAWRILDSQHFGVAQRRRRVFVVTDFRGQRAAEVLFEREGVSRDIGASRAAWAQSAEDLRLSAQANRIPRVARTVTTKEDSRLDPERETLLPVGVLADSGVVQALTQGLGSGGPDAAHAQAGWLVPVGFNWQNWSNDGLALVEEGVGPLDTSQTKAVAYADISDTLFAAHSGEDPGPTGLAPVIRCLNPGETQRRRIYDTEGLAPNLNAEEGGGQGVPAVATPYAVRRLMPVETERLQGFPDGHTEFDHTGKAVPNTHRYRMMGNAVTVPVAHWVAEGVKAALQ